MVVHRADKRESIPHRHIPLLHDWRGVQETAGLRRGDALSSTRRGARARGLVLYPSCLSVVKTVVSVTLIPKCLYVR